MPAWAVAVSVVGGVVLLGVGFAGGFGTGLLVSHRSSSAVERTDLRGSMMDRFSRDGGFAPDGRGFQRGGTGSGQGTPRERLLPNGTDGPTDGPTTSP